jgi:enoyl-CoA hydratase/carnithine racemase
MPSLHIQVTADARVLAIEFARREKKNAITTEMYVALAEALARATRDAEIACVLLLGQTDLFTAGNDVGDFLSAEARVGRAGHAFLHAIATFPKPIVAAVGGPAIGIGTTMLMHCDVVIAADNARFQLPFVKLGLCPEAGSSLLLPQMAGHRVAADLLLLGEPFDSTRAREAGIVTTVVAESELLAHARSIAEQLAHLPADALVTTKALLKRPWNRSAIEAIEEEYPHFERLIRSPEARAAFQSFLAKR